MRIDDEALIDGAAELARMRNNGAQVPHAIAAILKAEVATRDSATRHRLAREAQKRAEANGVALGQVALELLRVFVFALAA